MPANAKKSETKSKLKKIIKLESQVPNKPEPVSGHSIKIDFNEDELIFALDIGTRTVVGIIGIQEGDHFKIIGTEVIEHKHRAMLDGQIHNIEQVAEVVLELKDKLQQKLGISLTKVAIAAAGRVLRTSSVKVDREIEIGKEISHEMISSLEMEGIQQAQLKLDFVTEKEDKTQFYCVGYSVVNHYLNDYPICSLLGHRGNKISVEILATFLPHVVVDSLYTVMSRVGLEVISLTLEPIAAINVTIPKELRMLNLALVDIGAGTSDIALTKDGSVFAYAMAPIAGDEITERISQHYLVDFITAEKIKISLSGTRETITFKDILDKKHEVNVSDVLDIIKPCIEELALTISQKILEFNQKSPNAVFLIGGGCQIPGLAKLISENLKLPEDRVAVRDRKVIHNIRYSGKNLNGPEAVTPFGIAITAQMQRGHDFLSVTINGKKVRLFNSKKLTVADALILIGFNAGELIGRTGKSLTFDLGGQKKVIRGEYGKPAEIFVNGRSANLETAINIGDDIRVIPAENGKDAEVRVGNLVRDINPCKVSLNSSVIQVGTIVCINEKQIDDRDIMVNNGDVVETIMIDTVEDLLMFCDMDIKKYQVLVNGQESYARYVLRDLDVIECKLREDIPQPAVILTEQDVKNDEQDVSTNDLVQTISSQPAANFGPSVTINNNKVILKNGRQHIFVDMFEYIS
ncbi:MAG: actin-like ATPase involved in cell division, partial [Clostridiales bacterium]|nr:actin-like ATPase involved in cell division [Clostridiales bacterium]